MAQERMINQESDFRSATFPLDRFVERHLRALAVSTNSGLSDAHRPGTAGLVGRIPKIMDHEEIARSWRLAGGSETRV